MTRLAMVVDSFSAAADRELIEAADAELARPAAANLLRELRWALKRAGSREEKLAKALQAIIDGPPARPSSIDACVEIAERALEEWRQSGKD